MKKLLQHFVFWSVIVVWTSFLIAPTEKYIMQGIIFNLIRLPFIMLGTYFIIYFLLPKYLIVQKVYLKFSLYFFITFIIISILDRITISLSISGLIFKTWIVDFHWFSKIAIMRNTFILFSIIGLASLIRFFKLYADQNAKRMVVQEEYLKTKLEFLKSQINPHFLFNITNNLYSVAIENDQSEIASGLENLSSIMRYLTYESSADKVPLKKEIHLIENYIELQNLRIGEEDDVTISFREEGNNSNISIAPVILLPLVENAFKHGIKPNHKSIISIVLKTTDEYLEFIVGNTNLSNLSLMNSPQIEGIGLENVKNRLAILYPDSHILDLRKIDGNFETYLKLNF